MSAALSRRVAPTSASGPILSSQLPTAGLDVIWGNFFWRAARCHLLSLGGCKSMKTWYALTGIEPADQLGPDIPQYREQVRSSQKSYGLVRAALFLVEPDE
jgi:hypothetical protein